ncbi:hypothetical protein GCM10029976_049520 [Kribbella albertanoniae]|uniref:Uncharacterized protein n=1 Tax=Kribbella albertanoniae TaxID=1266829 RepID=A0A4R4PX61_9ACTN|nr:hypothetical protein [Kribbella albertanoniae]TDC26933.1 hypothetical protein E1261_21585 [Kribbella albertanoniae]
MDSSEQRIADSLARHAADAPSDHALLSTVHGRLRRRRTGRVAGAAVLAAAVIATAFTANQTLRTEPEVAQTKPGWRWESYKTAQVQVPDTWKQYIAGPAPCTFLQGGVPVIGRFYDFLPRDRYTCSYQVIPLKSRVPYVWFDDVQAPGIKQYDGGWSEETRLVGGTKVSVLAPNEALRREIIDTARPITGVDTYGCTPDNPRPATDVLNEEADGAEVCEYFKGKLVASSHLPPRVAAQLAKAMTKDRDTHFPAPAEGCGNSDPRTYVVQFHSGKKSWTMRLDYHPCVMLRPASLAVLRTGPHNAYDPSQLHDPVGPVTPPRR